jgi:hypothetical protein
MLCKNDEEMKIANIKMGDTKTGILINILYYH